jgi:predicted transcriptional regulator of viral defense system
MTNYERLDKLLAQHHGMVKTAQALEAGVSKPTFYAYARARELEQVAHGVFVSPDSWTDGMYLLHLRCGQAVFSHETALFFHDLTDREPTQYAVTVRTGYNPTRLKADGIQVYTVKKELHDIGITTMQTPFGHPVPVYDQERTICDLIRSRSAVEAQTFQTALKQYAQRRDKNLRRLMQYAALFRVERILRQYLEVLL